MILDLTPITHLGILRNYNLSPIFNYFNLLITNREHIYLTSSNITDNQLEPPL